MTAKAEDQSLADTTVQEAFAREVHMGIFARVAVARFFCGNHH
jgi:hypothetical protein